MQNKLYKFNYEWDLFLNSSVLLPPMHILGLARRLRFPKRNGVSTLIICLLKIIHGLKAVAIQKSRGNSKITIELQLQKIFIGN